MKKKDVERWKGILEIDYNRGVIYFHQLEKSGVSPTLLRICNIRDEDMQLEMIDITTGITKGRRSYV